MPVESFISVPVTLINFFLPPFLSCHQISGREMFEFNPDLVEADDLDAADNMLYAPPERGEEEEGQGEGAAAEGAEEGIDITDTAGYSDEKILPPPPQANVAGSNNQSVTAAGDHSEGEGEGEGESRP